MEKVTALIMAAGKGSRLGSDVPKQYLEISGRPLLYYALKAFENSLTDETVIVCPAGDEEYIQREIVEKYGLKKVAGIVPGGKERYNSVYNGLCDIDCAYVLIHDGARPFIRPGTINKVIKKVRETGAVVCGMPVKDTIKLSDAEGFVSSTTERALTWQIQTPQAFEYASLKAAYETILSRCGDAAITDDSMIYERAYPGKKILLLQAGYENIKITTPEDLKIAKALLE